MNIEIGNCGSVATFCNETWKRADQFFQRSPKLVLTNLCIGCRRGGTRIRKPKHDERTYKAWNILTVVGNNHSTDEVGNSESRICPVSGAKHPSMNRWPRPGLLKYLLRSTDRDFRVLLLHPASFVKNRQLFWNHWKQQGCRAEKDHGKNLA